MVLAKEKFTEEEWKKLKSLAKTKGKTFKSSRELMKHLQKLKRESHRSRKKESDS